jgi:hypothetical protein
MSPLKINLSCQIFFATTTRIALCAKETPFRVSGQGQVFVKQTSNLHQNKNEIFVALISLGPSLFHRGEIHDSDTLTR